METKEPRAIRNGHTNRILLSKENLERIDDWMDEVKKGHRGIKLTRTDLVNHLIQSHPKELSPEEMQQLGRLHFDEVRFANWALLALKEARAKGEDTTLQDLIKQFGATSK